MRKPPEDLPEQGVRNPAGARVLQQAAFPRLVEKGNRPGRNFKLTGQMEEAQKVKVLQTFYVTHDVKCIRLQKPVGFSFEPGQAADVSINRPGWEDEIRPFTFTCLPEDDYLEFTIKIYPDHDGVTHQLAQTGVHDELILHGVFGAIKYRGEGLFIAGGAGITPFLSILRGLYREKAIKGNTLLFGNKTRSDIIQEDELRKMLGDRFINILSEEQAEGYGYGLISRDVLEEQIKVPDQQYYLCGPPQMEDSVSRDLAALGIGEKYIVREDS
jgi:ferredoxin-NADP reductase